MELHHELLLTEFYSHLWETSDYYQRALYHYELVMTIITKESCMIVTI
jgi:hypothetical protein